MQFFKNLNIKTKLIVLMLISSVLITVVTLSSVVYVNISNQKDQLMEHYGLNARVLGDNCASAITFEDKKYAQSVIDRLEDLPKIVTGIIFYRNNKILAQYYEKDIPKYFREEIKYKHAEFFGNTLYIYEPIMLDGKKIGLVFFEVETPLNDTILNQIYISMIIFVISIGFAFIIAYILQRVIASPILDLTHAAIEISIKNDFSKRLEIESHDEIGSLVKTFNSMINNISIRQRERDKAEYDLNELNKKLEMLVEERTAKLEAAFTNLKEFAYITSHDLKSPLRGISQPAQWLLHDYSDKLDEEGQELLKLIINRVSRMDNLINGILDYLKFGNIDRKGERVDVNNIVEDCIEILAPPKNISIIVRNELPVILADKLRVERIFQNLIDNSISFMDKENGLIEIGSGETKTHWTFYVKDNGPGIEKKYHKKVFDLFQTLATKNDYKGTGIGLSIVKKIIDVYNGTIILESQLGMGTTLRFTIKKFNNKDGF